MKAPLKVVPRMAVTAGYWDIHAYVHWNKTNTMAEIALVLREDGREEIPCGPALQFDKKRWKTAAGFPLMRPCIFLKNWLSLRYGETTAQVTPAY
jgi:hypothetical protein